MHPLALDRQYSISRHANPVCHVDPPFPSLLPPPLMLCASGTQLVSAHAQEGISDTDVAIFVSPEFSINYYR